MCLPQNWSSWIYPKLSIRNTTQLPCGHIYLFLLEVLPIGWWQSWAARSERWQTETERNAPQIERAGGRSPRVDVKVVRGSRVLEVVDDGRDQRREYLEIRQPELKRRRHVRLVELRRSASTEDTSNKDCRQLRSRASTCRHYWRCLWLRCTRRRRSAYCMFTSSDSVTFEGVINLWCSIIWHDLWHMCGPLCVVRMCGACGSCVCVCVVRVCVVLTIRPQCDMMWCVVWVTSAACTRLW